MSSNVRLIYYSTATRNTSLTDLKDILFTARTNNSRQGVCGMLCYDNQYFLQVLEGHRETVSELFLEIADDPRHTDVVIVSCEPITEFVFDDWKMGYASSTEVFLSLLAELSQTEFDPEALDAQQMYNLLVHMSKHQSPEDE